MLDGKTLRACYTAAGNDLLADRLEGLFRELLTPEDIALHNSIQREVMKMVGPDKAAANMFYRAMAYKILHRDNRRTFRQIVSEAIMGVTK